MTQGDTGRPNGPILDRFQVFLSRFQPFFSLLGPNFSRKSTILDFFQTYQMSGIPIREKIVKRGNAIRVALLSRGPVNRQQKMDVFWRFFGRFVTSFGPIYNDFWLFLTFYCLFLTFVDLQLKFSAIFFNVFLTIFDVFWTCYDNSVIFDGFGTNFRRFFLLFLTFFALFWRSFWLFLTYFEPISVVFFS